MSDAENASQVIAGENTKQKVKTMLVDDNGVDIEQMQDIIKKQADMITKLSTIVKARDEEDADITRKLIVSKTRKWEHPFAYDELVDYSKDELDDLHKFICRVGRKDLTTIDEAPEKTIYKAVRKFPKLSRDTSNSYDVNQHQFSLSK